MRYPEYAPIHGLESRELRKEAALARQQEQEFWSLFPVGPVAAININQGSTILTLSTPLRMILPVAAHTIPVISPGDSFTGGFQDVQVPSGKQLCELAADFTANFTSLVPGKYYIHAKAAWVQENPYLKDPPGMFHAGEGATTEYVTFHNLPAERLGQPVPRPDFDPDLPPREVQERVDRITLGLSRELEVPGDVVRLFEVEWSGSSFTAVRALYTVVSVATIRDRLEELRSYTYGTVYNSLTSQHAAIVAIQNRETKYVVTSRTDKRLPYSELVGLPGLATETVSGFMSNVDKWKLDRIPQDAARQPTADELRNLIGLATQSRSGLMSATDKAKLDSVKYNASANLNRAETAALLGLRKSTTHVQLQFSAGYGNNRSVTFSAARPGDLVLCAVPRYNMFVSANCVSPGLVNVAFHTGGGSAFGTDVNDSDFLLVLVLFPADLFTYASS